MPRDYIAIATQYAASVTAGRIVSCSYTRMAAERFQRDLSRPSGPDFPYRLDERQATKFCAFIERCRHVEGDKGGEPVRLEPWQVFVVANAFGWVATGHDPERAEGLRRFRKVYIEVARGNGKSLLLSALCLAMLAIDGEHGANVFAAATKEEQARVVFDISRSIVKMDKERSGSNSLMEGKLGIETFDRTVTVKRTNSRFRPLSSQYKREDGKNISFCVVDELHAHETRGLWDVLTSGAGKRRNSMIWAITTAGYNLDGICYERRNHIIQILEQVVTDEEWFGCIWTIDKEDDWQDETCWPKANPNWNVSVDASYIRGQARDALATPSAQPEFLTKHLCMWLSSNQSWAHIPSWQECRKLTQDEGRTLEHFKGKQCYIGLDLASKVDLAAKVLLFPEDGKFYVFPTYYLPEAAVTDGRNAQYRGWQIEKRIKTTEGNVLDFAMIEGDLLKDMEDFDVQEVAIDPFEARQLVQNMLAQNVPMVEIGQTVGNLSEPTKELDAAARGHKLRFDCPILLWMASNVVVRYDTNDNVKPNKLKPEHKIDGVIALILSIARYLVHQTETSVYEEDGRGILLFG